MRCGGYELESIVPVAQPRYRNKLEYARFGLPATGELRAVIASLAVV